MSPRRERDRRPPRLATRLLEAALPPDRRGRSIAGDLIEEWHARAPGPGRTLWYCRECVRVAARYALVRRRLPGVPVQRARPRSTAAGGLPLPTPDEARHIVRRLLRSPLSSALTVVALGVGIAAPTVMYSLVVGVTRDLPVPEPEALVHVGGRYTPTMIRGARLEWVRPTLEDGIWPARAGLEALGAFGTVRYDLSGPGGLPERRTGAKATAGVFETLGVDPALGRALRDDDVSASEDVVVVSDALWRERFGADPAVLGRTLRVDGTPRTVIGVMPPRFAFPDEAAFWIPLDPAGTGAPLGIELVGRLAPDGSLAVLRQSVAAVVAALREEGTIPADVRGGLGVEAWGDRAIDRRMRQVLRLMVLLVSFVLVIACADVAHLFLARALARRRATAVRVALGAGRRVVGQHLLEAFLLAGAGGLLGLAIAAFGVRWLSAAMAARLSWWMELRLDPAVVAFSAGLVALAALATGLVPAFHASRLDVSTTLRDAERTSSGGRAAARLTGLLVAGEVALTCALLVVAGLLTRGALRNLDTGGAYTTASVLTARYELRPERHADGEAVRSFHRRLLERVSAEPGVSAAGLISHLPGIYALRKRVELEGASYERAEDRPTTHVVYASPGFLDALGVSPQRGRGLRWTDGRDAPLTALVNEPFVRMRLGGRDPLGTRLRLAPEGPGEEPAWATVVGVVPSLGLETGRDPDPTGIYLPLSASPGRSVALLVRGGSDATVGSLARRAREIAAALDPDLALFEVASIEAHQRANRDMETLFARLFLAFGLAGLVLAAVGLYGLMVFTLGRRVRELGIRTALGARPHTVAWTAVRAGATQVLAGLAFGLGGAALVAPLLGDLFMGYDPRDGLAYGVVAATLLLTGAAAALTPARRALSLDVSEVLRTE